MEKYNETVNRILQEDSMSIIDFAKRLKQWLNPIIRGEVTDDKAYEYLQKVDEVMHSWMRMWEHFNQSRKVARQVPAWAESVALMEADLMGLADKKNVTEQDVDPEQLQMGIKVEMEHTQDPEVAKKIALDHLAEFGTYYTALKEMEDRLRQQKIASQAEKEISSPASQHVLSGVDRVIQAMER